jgi:hypothetical protein
MSGYATGVKNADMTVSSNQGKLSCAWARI